MQVCNEELKRYISGAVYFEEKSGLVPYRFTKEKLDSIDDEYIKRRFDTATGITIDFLSDTEELKFKYTILSPCVDSLYNSYYFDVYVDNTMVLHQGERDIPQNTKRTICISLKKGYKRITIYLPSSCLVEISEFTVSSGSKVEKVKYEKDVMFFGDSITHAAYLEFSSMSYVNVLSRKLNYNFVNQAIGGDIFNKKHLAFLPDFKPDTVFVAYGTNNWMFENSSAPELIEEYFAELKKLYNEAQVYSILPIWRGDTDAHPEFEYSFSEIRKMIENTASKYGVSVLDGLNFIPQHELLMVDGYLHPNESGFMFYADSLQKALEKINKE